MFKGCFKEVSRVFQGNFMKMPRVFQERYKGFKLRLKRASSSQGVLRLFVRSLKDVLGRFQWCFKEVSKKFQGSLRVFQGNFKGISKKIKVCFKGVFTGFQGKCFKKVSRVFQWR